MYFFNWKRFESGYYCYIGWIIPKILVAPVFWFLYPRLKGHSRNRALMRFECEWRAIQLRNLDTILSSTRPIFGVPRKEPPSSAAYRCCYPIPTAGLTSLSRPIWSHIRSPVWSIDIYIYMFVRLLFWVGRGFCWINIVSVWLHTKPTTSLSFELLLSASQDVWLDHPSCPTRGGVMGVGETDIVKTDN